MKRLVIAVTIGALTLSGCGSGSNPQDGFEVTPELAAELGEEWPLTVSSATILCGEGSRLILMVKDASGTATGYALNGLAKDSGTYADLEAIWLDNPDLPGTKLPMWLTQYGAEKCGI